jgi:hypothetical protein
MQTCQLSRFDRETPGIRERLTVTRCDYQFSRYSTRLRILRSASKTVWKFKTKYKLQKSLSINTSLAIK